MKDKVSGKGRLCCLAAAGALLLASGVRAAEVGNDELQARFQEGMAALKEKRLKTAIEAFNSILSVDPGLHRARLELALAYYYALEYEAARKLAQEVLDDPATPSEVRVTVLAFLAQIEADRKRFQQRHQATPYVSLGLMYDSNVNVGPSSDVIDINGSLFRGGQIEDTAGVLMAGVDHRFQPGTTFSVGERTGSFLWLNQASLYHRDYIGSKDYNFSSLNVSTGPAWMVPLGWRAGVNLRLNQMWLGADDLALFSSVEPRASWQLGWGELTWDANFTWRDYRKTVDQGRRGWYMATGLSLGHYFRRSRVAVQGGARWFDFDARDDYLANRGWRAYLGASAQPWRGGQAYARASYMTLDFKGLQPAPVSAYRDDDEKRLVVGARHEFQDGWLGKWALTGEFLYTDNSSSVALYSYDRKQVSLNLSRAF